MNYRLNWKTIGLFIFLQEMLKLFCELTNLYPVSGVEFTGCTGRGSGHKFLSYLFLNFITFGSNLPMEINEHIMVIKDSDSSAVRVST
jgi:hypothetical protein